MKRRSQVRHSAEYLAFRLVVCIIDALPTRVCIALAEALGFVFHRVLPRKLTRYKVAHENLRLALGNENSHQEIDAIIRRMWVHLFRMIAEMVQLPRKVRLYNCAEVMSFRNRDEMTRAMCAGRPVMMLGGHFGNWEVANAASGMFGFPMGVVARDLDNPYIHAWFAEWRKQTGHRLISKRGGGSDMTAFLERRGALALLGDQDAGDKGLFVPFFGRPASTFKSIALLAVEYDAVICIGYARRLPDDFETKRWVHYEVGCEEVIDPREFAGADAVRKITERYTAALERVVRLAPEQYFWVHRRWKSVPRERRKKLAA